MSNRPTIVYVSGSPGSGKSTLAKLISEILNIPHVSSDLIHGGERFTLGEQNDRQRSLFENFIPLMLFMSGKGLSFVVDHVLQKNLSEKDIINKIKPKADIIYIHTHCSNPIERHLQRENKRIDSSIYVSDLSRAERKSRAAFHQNNLSATNEPLELGLPTLIVNTDNGYNPKLEAIIEFVQNKKLK